MVNCRKAKRHTLERHFKDTNASVFTHNGQITTVYDYLPTLSMKELRKECLESNRYQRNIRRQERKEKAQNRSRKKRSRSSSRGRRRSTSRSSRSNSRSRIRGRSGSRTRGRFNISLDTRTMKRTVNPITRGEFNISLDTRTMKRTVNPNPLKITLNPLNNKRNVHY